jgi:disulfide oxidoreductase YuzD
VDTLNAELIVYVESPIRTGCIHVETGKGIAGWMKRSDVRRKPCPTGSDKKGATPSRDGVAP